MSSALPTNDDATSPEHLTEQARTGALARNDDDSPGNVRAAVAFVTVQGSRHSGRRTGYVNTVLSVRVGTAVGSCAVEPGRIGDREVQDIVGRRVDELLAHPALPVRVAALDAYLAFLTPHTEHPRCRTVRIPAGNSLEKSTARAEAVAELTHVPTGGRVVVIGVVNSLLVALRKRNTPYVACDLKGGHTEWDEPVLTDHREAIDRAQAVLASGMVLGNGTFDEISGLCRDRDLPLTMFAQTGSAVLRGLLGHGIDALSAEPYPFFWLTGEETRLHHYTAGGGRP